MKILGLIYLNVILSVRLKGVVTNLTDYGCFVELEEGVEGLVHMS